MSKGGKRFALLLTRSNSACCNMRLRAGIDSPPVLEEGKFYQAFKTENGLKVHQGRAIKESNKYHGRQAKPIDYTQVDGDRSGDKVQGL